MFWRLVLALALSMPGSDAAAAAPLAVVTGSNTGIGLHVAGQLAAKGYDVVMACRNVEKAEAAVGRIRELYGGGLAPRIEPLDLTSFASVRSFTADLLAKGQKLDLLVCNAGLNSASVSQEPAGQLTADGVDVVWQSNYLSHWLLTLLLLPLLRAAHGRVINVTSVVHRGCARENMALACKIREPFVSLYGPSKLAQILSAKELHRRFGESGVAFHCVNPGGVASDIWRNYPGWQQGLFNALLIKPETAARTIVQASVSEEGASPAAPMYWNGYQGAGRSSIFEFWSPLPARDALVSSTPSELACDPELALQVWDDSVAALKAAGVEVPTQGELQAASPSSKL